MSNTSITPFPLQDLPGVTAARSPHTPDLTALRQGWSSQFQRLPSFPEITPTTSSRIVRKTETSPSLPEFPSLTTMADKPMPDGLQHTELLGFNTRQTAPKIPLIPETTFPSTRTHAVSHPPKPATLSAMPSTPAPEISIPLVRDACITPSTRSPKETQSPTAATHNPAPTPSEASAQTPEQTPAYTDADLREALRPIIDPCVDKFLYTPTHGIHTYLEPMLRSTVRRAIAEQMGEASPFREVSGWDKFAWKMRALLGSRDYQDIVFDHTKRYQVEEVFLLRPRTRSLISYASHDPSRHVKATRVHDTVKKIASKISKEDNENASCLKWENTRNLMIRRGEHSILAAIVHGPSNAILRADLDYALRQAEERFGKTLEDESDIHLQVLQPLLEGCLLIQAPAIPS